MGSVVYHFAAVALVFGMLATLFGANSSQPPRAAAEITWWRADMHSSPHTEPGFLHLRGWTDHRYPILGRSVDSQWIALRLELLNPGYAWTPLDRLSLNLGVAELPIIVATGMEVLSVDPGGGLGATYAATTQFQRWQWRSDNTIVGSNDQGLWHWNPLSGDLRRFAEPQWVQFSPDGRYAASGFGGDFGAGDWLRDVIITPVDGAKPIVFEAANQYRFTHHDSDPSLLWSPNSQYLLSTLYDEAWSGYVILGVDGSRVELETSGWAVWLDDATLRIRNGQRDSIYRPDGTLLRETEAARITIDPESSPPYPFDRPARGNPQRGWKQLLETSSEYAFAYWVGPDDPDSPDGAALYLYEARSNTARPLLGIERGAVWRAPHILWSDDQQRFAVSWVGGSVYIVEARTLRTIELPEVRGDALGALIDWSTDGNQLLIRYRSAVPEFGSRGFAAFPNLHSAIWPGEWVIAEYRIINAADGSVLHTFRADGNQCSNGHRAEWSPDGSWLAFGGLVVDCT